MRIWEGDGEVAAGVATGDVWRHLKVRAVVVEAAGERKRRGVWAEDSIFGRRGK